MTSRESDKVELGLALLLYAIGRGGGIRTHDPLHPMQVRYQAALRPDKLRIISELTENYKRNISIID